MEVSEQNGHRQEDDVAGVSKKQSHKLDHLSEGKHEDELGPEGEATALHVPTRRSPPAREEEERIDDECQRGESGDVKGIGAPPLLPMQHVRGILTEHIKGKCTYFQM